MDTKDLSTIIGENNDVANTVLGALVGIMFFLLVLLLVIIVLTIIGQWKSFKKAGEKGWAAIIPVYNIWVAMKVAMLKWYHFVILLVATIIIYIPDIPKAIGSICSLIAFIYSIIIVVKFSKAFGKSNGFCVMAVFLPFVAYMILGCGSAKYIGNKNKKET